MYPVKAWRHRWKKSDIEVYHPTSKKVLLKIVYIFKLIGAFFSCFGYIYKSKAIFFNSSILEQALCQSLFFLPSPAFGNTTFFALPSPLLPLPPPTPLSPTRPPKPSHLLSCLSSLAVALTIKIGL